MNFRKFITKILVVLIIMQLILLNYVCAEEIQNSEINQNSEELKIYSESAILIEEKTGKILYEKGMHDRKYPASTTKVLTAILAIENCNLQDKATASYEAVNSIKEGYTKANIQPGETFTIEELLKVLILQSANEAANVIAEHISGSVSEFAQLMNQKAKEIGCVDSNFVNANGAHDENHYSSAYDLAMIARYCMKNQTFRDLVKTMECSLPNTEFWSEEQIAEYGERIFKNTNNLLIPGNRYYYPYAIGIKAGFTTPAKNCLISGSNKNGFETIAVVLHAETTEDGLSARYIDTINLFEYGYSHYNLNDILKEYNMEDTNEVDKNIALASIENNNDNNTNKDNIAIEENSLIKSKMVEFIKIFVGVAIIFTVISVIFKGKRKHGKHEYIKDIYRFKLDS
ncbi:MAG TPA: D-alanyl-D-alanine carboxypeptidase [Candidatus Scatovivens faecipullorum]|nr:D-alanyl-D-alanine carboxypeptidase [Candidatus Scatovivens faecipullorum]